MGLYYRSRDFQLIETINEELIGEVVNTEIDVYKYNLYESEVNLYGEARSKVYYEGLRVAALIEQEDQSYDTAEYPGAELNQAATFNFLRKTSLKIPLSEMRLLYKDLTGAVDFSLKSPFFTKLKSVSKAGACFGLGCFILKTTSSLFGISFTELIEKTFDSLVAMLGLRSLPLWQVVRIERTSFMS